MSYGVVRTDKMSGTDVAKDLVSAKYMGSGSTATACDNGNVIKLTTLASGEREVYTGVTPAVDTALSALALVATPEVLYDTVTYKNLTDFTNAAGAIVRAYRLRSDDIFSVTADALNIGSGVTPAVGYVVEAMAGIKLNVVASLTGGSTQVGTILAIETVGLYTWYVIQVV